MSPQTISRRKRDLISKGWTAGLTVGLFSMLLFAAVANRLSESSFAVPALQSLWNNSQMNSSIGGQWTAQLLINLCKLIPGSSVHTLSVLTIILASLVQGFLVHDLVKRGCPPLIATLAAGLFALHPVMLYIATSGSLILIYAIVASFAIIALDRMEAIGDTQSLIVIGLSIALMMLTWQNAIFFVTPLLLLLPVAFSGGQSVASIAAMYIIVAAPSLIAVGAVAIGGVWFALPWNQIVTSWLSPLHGANINLVLQSAWLNTYGGRPIAAFLQSMLMCLTLMPFTWIIVIRLIAQKSERRRPATGLAAIFAPPIMGALATWSWQTSSPWVVMGVCMLSCSAWSATVRFRKWERWFWVAAIFCGVITSWLTPLLWESVEFKTWRQIVLAPINF